MNAAAGLSIIGMFIVMVVLIGIGIYQQDKVAKEQSSSFVGYSQSCWQVSDTLFLVTAKGDTVRFDVSKFR